MGNLTAIRLRNLKEPGRYSDGDGLILVFTKSGKGSWIVRVQNNGRRRDIGIGSYPDISLADAREAAATVRRQAKAGIDVVAERRRLQAKSGIVQKRMQKPYAYTASLPQLPPQLHLFGKNDRLPQIVECTVKISLHYYPQL